MEVVLFDQEKNKNIRQSNFLIEAKYKLTTQEFRVLTVLMAMISPYDSNLKKYQLRFVDIKNLLESKSESIVADLKKATAGLLSRPIIITTPEKIIQTNWISAAVFEKKRAFVEISISEELKPFLLQIKEFYTEFELQELLSLRSFYSSRLYGLMKQYINGAIPKREFLVDDLKEKLGCKYIEKGQEVDCYPDYGNFKCRVLNPAVLEINNKTNLKISFREEKKIGKKVHKIIFSIDKIPLQIEPTQPPKIPPQIGEDRSERTIENIKGYFSQKDYKSNPDLFFKHHEKKGWKDITDWTAAADEWELRHKDMHPDKHTKKTLTDIDVGQLKADEETRGIRSKIKTTLHQHQSSQIFFITAPIEKTSDGWTIQVAEKDFDRAIQHEELLRQINVKIEVKNA